MRNLQPLLTPRHGLGSDRCIFPSEDNSELFAFLGTALLERVPFRPTKSRYRELRGKGAGNYRQTVAAEVADYFGRRLSGTDPQRSELRSICGLETVLDIYRANTRMLADGPGSGDMFYYDPHAKRYTGQLKLLKGWCGSQHGVGKVMYMDTLHTESGQVIWAMFNRWIQENDFRYLDVHYGINQLTSYASTTYGEMADPFEERAVESVEHRKTAADLRRREACLVRTLLAIRKAGRKRDRSEAEIELQIS